MLGARRMSETMKQLRMKAPANPAPASLPLHFDVREQWPYCKDKMNEVRRPSSRESDALHLVMRVRQALHRGDVNMTNTT